MKQTAAILVTSLAAGTVMACSVSVAEKDVDMKETQQRMGEVELERIRECADDCYSWECDRYTCDAQSLRYDESCCQGRPLIVDGTARVAAVEERDDWVI